MNTTEGRFKMGVVKINRVNTNDEILVKLMDSAAAKYDCHVNYESDTQNVSSDCDEAVKTAIVNQVAGIFGVKEEA